MTTTKFLPGRYNVSLWCGRYTIEHRYGIGWKIYEGFDVETYDLDAPWIATTETLRQAKEYLIGFSGR